MIAPLTLSESALSLRPLMFSSLFVPGCVSCEIHILTYSFRWPTAYWKNSKAAKADAVQWVNQRNIRIVLEHLTSEVLQTLPEDPLEFMITTLQKGQEQMSTADRPGTAMSTRPATAKSLGKGEDEMLETMQKELDNW